MQVVETHPTYDIPPERREISILLNSQDLKKIAKKKAAAAARGTL